MKKNIEALTLDRALTERLVKQLEQEGGPAEEELGRALTELLDGSCASLLLDLDGRAGERGESCIHCGQLVIYTASRKVSKNGEDVSLTPKEYDILCLLARNQGQVFTKEQIYRAVWDEDYYMDSSNIMAFIRKIRKKIETNPDDPQYIQTVWGIGYRFGAPE